MSTNFKEACWFVYGLRTKALYLGILVRQSTGGPASVDFDWQRAFRHRKHLVGFFHTHPDGVDELSQTDHRTMRGWVTSLGKPLICGIKEDGQTQMFYYKKIIPSGHIAWQVPFLKLLNLLIVWTRDD
jgi:hypothetical protein